MATRVTESDIDRTCEALTARMHADGTLHPESRFIRTGAYGRTGVAITGGPFYGSGQEALIHGTTKRECQEALWAIQRAASLGRRSTNPSMNRV